MHDSATVRLLLPDCYCQSAAVCGVEKADSAMFWLFVSAVTIYKATGSMEQSPSLEAEVSQFSQSNFPHFMEFERSSPYSQQRPICPHLEPNQTSRVPSYIFNIHFDIFLLSVSSFSKWPLSFRFFKTKILLCISLLRHVFYMRCPSHPPWLDRWSNDWLGLQTTKLLIMQFSPLICYFDVPRFKSFSIA
jgi:hypothetical protein